MINEENNLLQEAIKLYESTEYDSAEKIFRKILVKEPNNYDVLQRLGVCLFQNQKPDKAVRFLKKALKFSPEKKAIIHNLCGIC